MTVFGNSMEELSLVRALNLEYVNEESEWTPIRASCDFSDETIKHIIKLSELRGGFYSRVWVIKDKKTKRLIGIMSTLGLSQDGYSTITRQLLKKYTGKGLGSEALLSIFEHYSGFQAVKVPKIDQHILKMRIQETLFNMAEALIPPCKLVEFKDYFLRGEFSDIAKLFKITNLFPDELPMVVRSALTCLKQPVREERFSGFISTPISEAAVRSLEKCGFIKLGDQYKKSCGS